MVYPVVEVFLADIYRDGGSRCFCYRSNDGNWYEFHLQVNRSRGRSGIHYDAPVLYLNSVNDGNVVHRFTWNEAQDFVADLHFDHPRFAELINVVNKSGQ